MTIRYGIHEKYTEAGIVSGVTGAAPTTAEQGVAIDNAKAFRVIVSAGLAKTIASGKIELFLYSTSLGRWVQSAATLDFTPRTGVRDSVSADYSVGVGWGRVYARPAAIATTDASTFDVMVEVAS